MRTIFMSRVEAERFTCRVPYAVISVIDPKQRMGPLQTDSMRVGRLIRRCQDLGAHPEEPFWDKGVYFSEADAEAILEFVERMLPSTDRFVVHCEAGISRSCGVATALHAIYGGPPPLGDGIPNLRIVRMLIERHAIRIERPATHESSNEGASNSGYDRTWTSAGTASAILTTPIVTLSIMLPLEQRRKRHAAERQSHIQAAGSRVRRK